ncbi:MAG TPA: ketopantoate reductase family protein [Thermoplasmata archaeon]|nr:ketopantoate reductase family protein [Thermoplasmata archaeon]
MRILVFGAGAIGSLLAGLLSRENEVTMVARKPHVDAVNRQGLRISGLTTLLAWPTAAADAPSTEFDVVFVATKAYDTTAAVEALRAFWRHSVFVTLQNGLGNAETLAAKTDRVIAGTTTHGVTFVAPGEIVHAGAGDTMIGPWKGVKSKDADLIARMLTASGIATSVTDDVRQELWGKALVNAAINPLTAVLRRSNGELVRNDDLRALAERIVREGTVAAAHAGVVLDADATVRRALDVAHRTAENRSSMLQDIEHGHRTEVEAITGAILRAAGADPMPYNHTVYALVRGLEGRPRAPL